MQDKSNTNKHKEPKHNRAKTMSLRLRVQSQKTIIENIVQQSEEKLTSK